MDLRDLGGKVLRLWEVRGWGAYQNPSTPGQQMTFVKDYLHGAEGVFGSWGNCGPLCANLARDTRLVEPR